MSHETKQPAEWRADEEAGLVSARQSSELCQACGLCCSGTLFSYVDLSEKDAKALKGTAVKPYVNARGKQVMDLPCSALEGSCCSVYAVRPRVCRTYLCELTRAVLNGGTALDDALDAVAEMKAVSAWLQDNVPEDASPVRELPPKRQPASARDVLKLWSRAADKAAPEAEQPKSVWLLLDGLHGHFARKQQAGALEAGDQRYVAKAFAYAKLCDRFFEETPLLRKYAELVQRL